MNLRSASLFLAGAAAGVAALLSCGDDSPGTADAQPACDCPASEPPIAAARFEVRSQARTVPAGQTATQSAGCASTGGGILMSGGCLVVGTQPDVDLIQANFDVGSQGDGWRCSWQNNTATDVMAEVQIKCLMPAQ